MKISKQGISEQFSKGNFPFCYEYFSDAVQWNIIGSDIMNDKQVVIAYCDKMMIEMNSSTLNNTNIIAVKDNVVIEGYCNYTDADNKSCKVSYCDIYHFNNDQLANITSYCIDKKL